MSLLTGQYYSVARPPYSHSHLENGNANGVGANGNGKNSARRKFFQSETRWDVGVERVLVRVVDVGRFMEVGGMEGMDELGFEGWDNGQEGEESQDDG